MLTTSQLLRAANNKYLMQEFPQPKLLGTKNIHEIHHYEPVLFSNSSPQGRGTVRNMKLVLQSEQNLPLPCCTQATDIRGLFSPSNPQNAPTACSSPKSQRAGGAVCCSFIFKDLIDCFLSEQKNTVNKSEHYRKPPHSIFQMIQPQDQKLPAKTKHENFSKKINQNPK